MMSIPPVNPRSSVDITSSSTTASSGKKRRIKTAGNQTAFDVSAPPEQIRAVQVSSTPGASTFTPPWALQHNEIVDSSSAARKLGILLRLQETADASIGRPSTQSSTSTRSTYNSVLPGAASNSGPRLMLPNVPPPVTGPSNPSSCGAARFTTLSMPVRPSAEIGSQPAVTQVHTPEFPSGPHPRSSSSSNNSLGTTTLEDMVKNVTLLCDEEDAIRLRMAQLDESIASTVSTLQGMKRERLELQVQEACTRRRRVEALRCLQKATVGLQKSPTQHMLPDEKRSEPDVSTQRVTTENTNQALVAPRISQGPFPVESGQVTGSQASDASNHGEGTPASRMC